VATLVAALAGITPSSAVTAQPPTGLMSITPSPPIVGKPSTLTVNIGNPNSGAATPQSFGASVDLGTGLRVANTPHASNGCGGTFMAIAGETIFELSGGSTPADTICTFSADVLPLHVGPTTVSLALTSTAGNGSAPDLSFDVLTPPAIELGLDTVSPTSGLAIDVGGHAKFSLQIDNPSTSG
jgi:hypothetical protein